jgi:hypothetical protein
MRIKNQGLTYFPLDVDFVRRPAVRRISKRQGDAAISVLLHIIGRIYGNNGYYVDTDEMFYEDIAADLYEKDAEYVRQVVDLAVDYQLFDKQLFTEKQVLTSKAIQQQFLFCTKRRKEEKPIKEEFRLTGDDDNANNEQSIDVPDVTKTAENVTQSTQSKAQHSTAKKRTTSLKVPPVVRKAKTEVEEVEKKVRREAQNIYQDIEDEMADKVKRLEPPADSIRRNFDGLRDELARYNIPFQAQYAIICRSNFGVIGHPVWKALANLREDRRHTIRMPDKYLLSYCR